MMWLKNQMVTKNNKDIFYVYTYLDLRKPGKYVYGDGEYSFDYEPFYIGKGSGQRKIGHLKESSLKQNSPKNNKIKKIIKEVKEQPKIIILKDNLSEQYAFDLEIKLVALIGRKDLKKGPLSNLTDAGEGVSGLICSIETKINRSKNSKGKNNSNYGNPNNFKHSIETKNKMSESRKGEKNANYGNKYSTETKKKLSEIKQGYTPWNKGKKCESLAGENNPNYGKKHSEETKEKIKQAHNKKIINSDGVVFESLLKTGEYYNVSIHTIYNILKGRQKNKFGLSYVISK